MKTVSYLNIRLYVSGSMSMKVCKFISCFKECNAVEWDMYPSIRTNCNAPLKTLYYLYQRFKAFLSFAAF